MFRELFYIYIYVFASAIKADQSAISYMRPKLTVSKDKVICEQNKDKIYSVKAFEGEPLHISIDYDKLLHSVECYDKNVSAIIFISKMHIHSKEVIEVNVTENMGCNWICKISVDLNNNLKHLIEVYCYIKVHVRLTKAPHKMRVNYMIMEPTRESINTHVFDHYAEYKYKNGDKVNIFCYKEYDLSKKCRIIMKYYYDELKDHILVISSHATVQSNINLHLKHNGSFIDCIYICEKDYQVQRMKFVLKKYFHSNTNVHTHDIKLLINEQDARIDMENVVKYKSDMRTISVDYYISEKEHFDIKCGDDEDYYKCDTNCTNALSRECISATWKIKNITNICTFNCGNSFNNLNIQLKIQRSSVPEIFGSQYLSVNLPNNNIVMNFLGKKKRVIYYEFDESNKIAISCIRTERPDYETYISTNKKLKADSKTNMQNDTLKISHHGVYTCVLYDLPPKKTKQKILYNITVIFVKKNIDSIEMTTSDFFANEGHDNRTNEDLGNRVNLKHQKIPEPKYTIIYIGVGIVTAIMIICVSIVVYKMNKRNQVDLPVCENFNSETTTSQHHRQLSDERYVAESNSQAAPTHTVTIPINQGSHRIEQDDSVLYVELYHQAVSGVKPQQRDRSTYVEVCSQEMPKPIRNYKNNQDNYANCFPDSPYVNSEHAEYVEPTYTEDYSKYKI